MCEMSLLNAFQVAQKLGTKTASWREKRLYTKRPSPLRMAWPTAVGAERTRRVPSRQATRQPSPTQATPREPRDT